MNEDLVEDPMNKAELMAAVQVNLRQRLDAMRAAADEARLAATHEEARPENDKDTRSVEQSYLARGQAMRVEELEEAATRLKFLELRTFGDDAAIEVGALVTLLVDEQQVLYFLVPEAGGTKVLVAGVEVRLVTPAAPLGRALLEKRAGDDFVLVVAGREREYEIERVR